MHGNHVKHMLVGAGVVLAALLVVGLPVGTALPWALLLACPLMMGAMMLMMMRNGGHEHGPRHDDHGHELPDADQPPTPTGHRRM